MFCYDINDWSTLIKSLKYVLLVSNKITVTVKNIFSKLQLIINFHIICSNVLI